LDAGLVKILAVTPETGPEIDQARVRAALSFRLSGEARGRGAGALARGAHGETLMERVGKTQPG